MSEIAFLITNRYQIHHYEAIARHLGPVTVVIEVRDRDFEVDDAFVRRHMPAASILTIPSEQLRSLDGMFDLIVCQTPVLPNLLLGKSLVVAQQYSLSKETYQYGVWRSLVSMNLMYGEYSVNRVRGFSNAIAAGNPMFDRWFERERRAPDRASSAKHGLYLPTYGSLSSIPLVASHLAQLDGEITVKLHHSEEPELAAMLPDNCVVLQADADPVELYESADYVISDISGAAYDALYARRPLVLVGNPNATSEDYHRLSDTDLGRGLLSELAATWTPGQSFEASVEDAERRLDNEQEIGRFTEQLFSNHGAAGMACARAILDLLEHGEPANFAREQVRDRSAELMVRARELAADNRRLRDANNRLRSRPRQVAARTKEAVFRQLRPVVAKSPRIESAALSTKRSIAQSRQQLRLRRLNRTGTTGPEAGTWSPADERYSVVGAERRLQMLELVEQAMVEARLDHGVDLSSIRPAIAVMTDDKPALVDVLNRLAVVEPGLEVRALVRSSIRSKNSAADIMLRHVFSATSLRVGVPLVHRNFRLIEAGYVDVVFVQTFPEKQRVLAIDPASPRVDWTADFVERSGVSGARPPATTARMRDVGEIDVVYTWVDSSDPLWHRSHREHSALTENELATANNPERFLDREELRYSLRSLWLHAPFVRHIYLVTADQRPTWLDDSDERITVVSHSEIFPDRDMLPTFNSHAIEACLHRIPGLSEHFVYMNDDVFIGREVTDDTFYTKAGQARIRMEPTQYIYRGEPEADAIPTDWAAYNAARLIERDFGLTFDRKLQHVGHPMRRSVLEEIEQRYPEEVERTRRAKFRSGGDLALPSMFAPYYAIASHEAVESPLPEFGYIYADTGRADYAERFADILRHRPVFYCLNSTKYTAVDLDVQAASVRSLLEGLYPFASPFERS